MSNIIFPYNVALSDHEGFGYLNIINNEEPVSTAYITYKDKDEKTCKVKLMTVDYLIKLLDLTSVDIVKIDVEGHELQVLRGAINSLRNQLIRKLVIEVHTIAMENLPYIARLLKNNGYIIDGIFEGVLYAKAG
ncbi:MAG: FkbM family methyltransferase [Fervidobacterium sp.]